DHRLILSSGQRVLIAGAGSGGDMLVRDLLRTRTGQYQPVGFADDDRRKQGKEIHGFRVFGPIESIPDLVQAHAVDLVMIAIPSANSRDMRRIVQACEKAGVPFRTLPGTQDIASGRAAIQTLREVSIDDLLGREPVSLDWKAIETGLTGRTVMVTGGGGSIGSELCRQIARLDPARLVVFENSEFNLYQIQLELEERAPKVKVQPYLGDVTDRQAVEQAFAQLQPEVVFHAAAYKHVPMLEGMVRSAVRNNVIGTRIVADAAGRHRVATFVLISTDKAVNPTNVMGASKRMAELYCQNLDAHSDTRYITVRFGNVLGSAGSVVPLFREQIARGGPVTVTHPEVTRFFMTIPEACQLIMQAAVLGRGGEIFVLDMGEPIRISYLAEQMIRLAGKTPNEDVEILFSGLRPGEKLQEELFHEKESLFGTEHAKILRARYRRVDWSGLEAKLDALARAVEGLDDGAVTAILQDLVPEFRRTQAGEAPSKVVPFEEAREK
ncbi:MAG: polysaccharide biosynthesis protein, partial [Gammaproteobacteria bacterium]|nr:polysaccharide biosynthesis protein [Gammaproteobacteria bacterium]NIR97273.1 polysaccharide biosynthesis protein [Gammaproteobacteria bacterium]